MKREIYCIVIITLFTMCKKDDVQKDSNGVVISQPHIWTTTVTDDDVRSNNFLVKRKVEYNNGVLVSAKKNGKNIFRMIDLNDGATRWEWNDFIKFYSNSGIDYYYLNDKNLTFTDQFYSYKINVSTGQTVLKKETYESLGLAIKGIGNEVYSYYYITKDGANKNGGYIAIINNNTFDLIDKFQPKYDTTNTIAFDDGGYNYAAVGLPFEKNGDTFIIVRLNDPPTERGRVGNQWFSLYNYSKKQWIYERQSIQKQSVWGAGSIYIDKDKVFTYSVGWVACHDLMTGQQLWKTVGSYGDGYLFAGLLIANGKVYANNDSGQLACFEISSGRKLWDIRSSGSSTELSYLNGVVYFVGGGDGKLHAVDAETGDYLWKIVSPDLSKNKSAIFSGLCAVIAGKGSEKGKVVVLNGLNAYCYEAIR